MVRAFVEQTKAGEGTVPSVPETAGERHSDGPWLSPPSSPELVGGPRTWGGPRPWETTKALGEAGSPLLQKVTGNKSHFSSQEWVWISSGQAPLSRWELHVSPQAM